jgi:hypothetical protein
MGGGRFPLCDQEFYGGAVPGGVRLLGAHKVSFAAEYE